jgi:hypothetical protein
VSVPEVEMSEAPEGNPSGPAADVGEGSGSVREVVDYRTLNRADPGHHLHGGPRRGAPAHHVRLATGNAHPRLLVCVEDEGPGVPDELKASIFEPFRKGEPGTPGSGIGLSLVSRFAEFHGGRAWVQDRPGGGAAFLVFLPGPDGEHHGANGDRQEDGDHGAGSPGPQTPRARRGSATTRNPGGLARVRPDVLVDPDVLVSKARAGEDTRTFGPTGRPA